ncbi:MAG: diaminopimelate decarboxylase [Candidatus Sumerlaeia bacterium]|nr:diaminopimelate decarboxylase [Candidatus Sumerlaeia bacterium]
MASSAQNPFGERPLAYGADGALAMDGHSLEAIARDAGTPCYVYSAAALRARARRLKALLAPGDQPAFSVKACSSLGVLKVFADEGLSFDIVSGGELARLRRLGVEGARIVFSGAGKSAAELQAALEARVRLVNIESLGELDRLRAFARGSRITATVALRVNPDVAADTHEKIATGHAGAKFGLTPGEARQAAAALAGDPWVRLEGLHIHLGSMLRRGDEFARALQRLEPVLLSEEMRPHKLQWFNLGGGVAIPYRLEEPATDPKPLLSPGIGFARRHKLRLMIEPGRYLVGPCGVLLTAVEYVKDRGERCFVVADAAMTELLRPALYGAWHEIVPVRPARGRGLRTFDVVGPVCETGDTLGAARTMPLPNPGDLLAVLDCGAYASSMASGYNSRPLAAEVLVDGETIRRIRRRQSAEELLGLETP